jgi:hypothetical protein
MAVFVAQGGKGVGPIKDVVVKNIRARKQGGRNGFLQGYDASSMVSGVTFSDVYMWANTTPATTLEEMNLRNISYLENVKFDNTAVRLGDLVGY